MLETPYMKYLIIKIMKNIMFICYFISILNWLLIFSYSCSKKIYPQFTFLLIIITFHMTLEIKVLNISGSLSKGDLYLFGTKTGLYKITNEFSSEDQRRITFFSENQCIQFSLYQKNSYPEPRNRKAFINQPCQLIKQFILKNASDQNVNTKYDIQLYNERDEPISIVHLLISYQKRLLFQGTIPKVHENKSRQMKFYKGSNIGSENNLFNFLDFCFMSGIENQEFKPIQTVYNDKFQ